MRGETIIFSHYGPFEQFTFEDRKRFMEKTCHIISRKIIVMLIFEKHQWFKTFNSRNEVTHFPEASLGDRITSLRILQLLNYYLY